MDIGQRINDMGKQLLALGIVTAILSIGGIVGGLGPAGDGDAFGYTRIALGLLGLAGAAMLVLGKDHGKTGLMLILAWAAIQTLYYADAPDGNYTRQLIDGLLGVSSSTTVNGEVTEYSAVGINLIGLVMLLFAYASRNHITRWQNRSTTTASA